MTIGIDLGNHSTKLSNLTNGKINIILNKSSQRSSKTLMSFKDIRYFGDDAYSQQVNNYKNTVSGFTCFTFYIHTFYMVLHVLHFTFTHFTCFTCFTFRFYM